MPPSKHSFLVPQHTSPEEITRQVKQQARISYLIFILLFFFITLIVEFFVKPQFTTLLSDDQQAFILKYSLYPPIIILLFCSVISYYYTRNPKYTSQPVKDNLIRVSSQKTKLLLPIIILILLLSTAYQLFTIITSAYIIN